MTPDRNWLRVGLVALAVVLFAQSVAHAIAVFAFGSYTSEVDLDRNNSLFDVVSVVVIMAGALAAVGIGRTRRLALHEAEPWILAGLFVFLAVADVVRTGTESVSATGGVVALGFAAFAFVIWRVARSAGGQAAFLLVTGLACLVGSLVVSFVFHRVVNDFLDLSRGDVLYEMKLMVKEGLELTGWWLIALGLWVAVPARAVEGSHMSTGDDVSGSHVVR